MSWRDDKAEKLQKSRDFSFLHDGDRQKEPQRSRQPKSTDDRVSDKVNQEARDRLLRLKALEKQRAAKQKKQHVESVSPDTRNERREAEKNPVSFGNKRVVPYDQNFGSFFGKVEKVVARRIQDEQRAREISARAKQVEVQEAKAKADSRKGSSAKQSSRPSSGSGSKPAPKPQKAVNVKVQKLKDNRDYSFLFSEEPSKTPAAGGRDSNQELNNRSKDHPVQSARDRSEAPRKQQSHAPQVKLPSNGKLRTSDQGLSSSARKSVSGRPSTAGEREKYAKDSRQDSQRRPEKERGIPSSRVPALSKSSSQSGPSSRGPALKVHNTADRDKRANLERPKSSGHPKPMSYERPVARDSVSMKSSSQVRVSQTSIQRNSHSTTGNGNLRDRVVQKSTTANRVTQSVHKGSQNDTSTMKRKMAGEPTRRPMVTAKANDGRRVDRSRYDDSASESEDERNTMRKLVSGGPKVSQSAGPKVSQSSVGVKHRVSNEPVRSRPAPPKQSKRPIYPDSDSGYESDDVDTHRGGVSSIIQKLFRYDPNKYKDIDDEDDRNMETSFRNIQAEERRSAKLAREEDEREQEAIEREEHEERLRKLKKQKMK